MAVNTLTARELEVLHAVVQVGTVSVDDWDKVAEIAGMKTGKYARDTWGGARKKLNAPAPKGGKGASDDKGEGDGANGETPKGKGKPKSTPRKRKADDLEDDETPVKATPSKKTPKSKSPKKSAADDEVKVKDEPNEAGELMDDLIV